MKIERRPVAERELSLIERAGELWGFDGGLRPANPHDASPVHPEPVEGCPALQPNTVRAEPVEALSFSAPAGSKKGSTSTSSVRTEVGGGSHSASVRPAHVEGRPASQPTPVRPEPIEGRPTPELSAPIANAERPSTSSGRTGEEAPSFLHTAPESQPLDLTEPALPEWAAPAGVAAIDRVMLAEKGMLVPGAPVGALAEEFRLVKRQLLLTAREVADGPLGQRARTILVGSGKPGDGKTYSAINLAISLAAERDVEILLVDADFAKPDVLKRLGVEETVGLLDILGDPTLDPEDCIVRTDVPQLALLPAGRSTTVDTELLASRRTEEVIDRLLAANPKRMIVFDTPPTLAASPASVLALLVGQVMLVVRADRTTEADVREAVGLLAGCEHISLVLNAVSYQPGGGRFGSYYGQEKSR